MKKLSKLKLKDFVIMNDSEMKSIVGGDGSLDLPYELGDVTVYGSGPNYCKDEFTFNLPVRCDDAMAHRGAKCRTADCKRTGQCKIVPMSFQSICDLTAVGGMNYPIGRY